MKIVILSRALFDEYLRRKGVTDDNVETQDKMFFISIRNQDDKTEPFFKSDKSNVKIMTFADLEEDKELPVIGEERTELFKAMSREQAAELYQFIKANKDKEAVMIHCTAGVARSGAVGVFINDFIGGNYHELMRNNPSIQPNPHVYRLLHNEWYKDIAYNDAVTGEPIDGFKLEILNPASPEQLVAQYNQRNPDQHTSTRTMTLDEVRKQYPGVEISVVPDKGPSRYEEVFPNGDRVVGGSNYIMGVDPYRNEAIFEQFWLETDKYYGMVEQKEIEIIRELHPIINEIYVAKKKVLHSDEFEAFPSFGIGDEYTGITLGEWLRLKNMRCFFNKKTATDKPSRIEQDLLDLIYESGWTVQGKPVISVDLAVNGYDVNTDRDKLKEWFMNKLVTYKNALFIVKGIESHAAMNRPHDKVGLMLEPWGLWHQIPPDLKRIPYDKDKFKLP